MATAIANLLRVCDLIFGAGASMAIINLFTNTNPVFSFAERVSVIVQVGFGVGGLLYFAIRSHHFFHNSRIDRDIKREELKKMKKENE